MLSLLAALATLAADASAPATIHDVVFAPPLRGEAQYASLGPAGPFYPERAVRAGVDGEAVLDCAAKPTGALQSCKIVSETPAGYSFGAAATVMAHRHRLTLASPVVEGQPVRIRVPFVRARP